MGSYPEPSILIHSGSWVGVGGGSRTPVVSLSATGQNTQANYPSLL